MTTKSKIIRTLLLWNYDLFELFCLSMFVGSLAMCLKAFAQG